jgi:hypothetical protein
VQTAADAFNACPYPIPGREPRDGPRLATKIVLESSLVGDQPVTLGESRDGKSLFS